MIKLENTEVVGWEHAVRGMRNPMNSWDKSDSMFVDDIGDFYTISGDSGPWPDETYVDTIIGSKDLALMKKLAAGGPVHAKYRRMINVYVDITAPLYWWKEFDTYKVGTVANSCSTMHKIHEKPFVVADFSCEHLGPDSMSVLQFTINHLNRCRNAFLELTAVDEEAFARAPKAHGIADSSLVEARKDYWWQMIQLLPSSYNQKRTLMMSYEVLVGIYRHRLNHKLDEWRELCGWIEALPYSDIITGGEKVDVN